MKYLLPGRSRSRSSDILFFRGNVSIVWLPLTILSYRWWILIYLKVYHSFLWDTVKKKMCRKLWGLWTETEIITCSFEVPSVTLSSSLSEVVSLAFVESGGSFLLHFRPKGSSGFGALPRESLAGLIAVSLDTFTFSVFSDLIIRTKQCI